ncbi:hypothetical protein [Shinella sp.]|uniref:hypothetical protein n=1 Tax=Shinella sp. TaxID=1870904 RepID=UPI003F6EAC04
MSSNTREIIDAVLKVVIDQVPTMTVREITTIPEHPKEGDAVIARIDVSNNRLVYCEIDGNGSLSSASVIDLNDPDEALD